MAYATVDEFRAWFGIESDSDDQQIAQALDVATAWFEGQTGRVFAAESDTTQYFDAECDVGLETLYFYDLDLCQITSVVNGDGLTIAADQYVTLPLRHMPCYAIRLKQSAESAWTFEDTPEDAISVTGRWAYSATPPADAKQAVLDVAQSMYKQRDNGSEALEPTVSPTGMMIVPSALPKSVWGAVGRYKRRI